MGNINSKAKGKRAEIEVRDLFRDRGYEARRGQQFSGGADSPDVVTSLEGYHIEVKHVEALNVYKALAQSKKDAGLDKVPLVFHRRNGVEWHVTMNQDDFFDLLDKVILNDI